VSIAPTAGTAPPVLAPPTGQFKQYERVRRILLILGLAILALSFVRTITHTNDLTSSGTFGAALRVSMPILLAALGGLYAERAGVVNIGLEGMMILGTWFGAWAGWHFGAWVGVLAGLLGGAVGGLIHAVATVTFNINHIVSGVAINILAAGATRFLSVVAYQNVPGAGITQSPQVTGDITHVNIPFLAGGRIAGFKSPDLFGWLEKQHWLVISDVGGLLKGFTSQISLLTIIALLLVPISYVILWRTVFGLRLRSVGEHPVAAESLGVRVYTLKYIAVVISGALAGLGGAFLVIEQAAIYREGQTGGRGFIALAALIFGNWRPAGLAAGAGLFGYSDALQLRSSKAILGLVLFVAIGLAGAALYLLYRRKMAMALGVGVLAGLVFWWHAVTNKVPNDFVTITPYVVTLLVLAVAAQRLRPPAADGRPYRKGEAT
jgi:general nucleoside transport system permease protein